MPYRVSSIQADRGNTHLGSIERTHFAHLASQAGNQTLRSSHPDQRGGRAIQDWVFNEVGPTSQPRTMRCTHPWSLTPSSSSSHPRKGQRNRHRGFTLTHKGERSRRREHRLSSSDQARRSEIRRTLLLLTSAMVRRVRAGWNRQSSNSTEDCDWGSGSSRGCRQASCQICYGTQTKALKEAAIDLILEVVFYALPTGFSDIIQSHIGVLDDSLGIALSINRQS
jgi:hypothetical protein